MLRKINPLDIFTFFNIALFLAMLDLVYYKRFIAYRGLSNIHEFFFYAATILSLIIYVWVKFRHISIPSSILIFLEVAILIHFSGAFIEINGARLYDFRFYSVRYDKIVHFINSMIGTTVVIYLLGINHIKITKFTLTAAILITVGCGAIIEIMEFFVVLTVPHNGVGDYINNMSDLVANLLGSIIIVIFYYNKKMIR